MGILRIMCSHRIIFLSVDAFMTLFFVGTIVILAVTAVTVFTIILTGSEFLLLLSSPNAVAHQLKDRSLIFVLHFEVAPLLFLYPLPMLLAWRIFPNLPGTMPGVLRDLMPVPFLHIGLL